MDLKWAHDFFSNYGLGSAIHLKFYVKQPIAVTLL